MGMLVDIVLGFANPENPSRTQWSRNPWKSTTSWCVLTKCFKQQRKTCPTPFRIVAWLCKEWVVPAAQGRTQHSNSSTRFVGFFPLQLRLRLMPHTLPCQAHSMCADVGDMLHAFFVLLVFKGHLPHCTGVYCGVLIRCTAFHFTDPNDSKWVTIATQFSKTVSLHMSSVRSRAYCP